jgi:MinD superfamily P-loop ATPase
LARTPKIVGRTYRSNLGEMTLFTGELSPTAEESARVIRLLKARAFRQAADFDLFIVDTSPGTHCNVIFALEGADHVLAITELSPLGAHDLELILSLLETFSLPGWVVINRAEISGTADQVPALAVSHDTPVKATFPLDNLLVKSYVEATPVVRMFPQSHCSLIFSALAHSVVEKLVA